MLVYYVLSSIFTRGSHGRGGVKGTMPMKKNNQWRRFLRGFSIPAGLTVVIGVSYLFIAIANVDSGDGWSGVWPIILFVLCAIGLAIAVVSGLIGMWIGSIADRKKRD